MFQTQQQKTWKIKVDNVDNEFHLIPPPDYCQKSMFEKYWI